MYGDHNTTNNRRPTATTNDLSNDEAFEGSSGSSQGDSVHGNKPGTSYHPTHIVYGSQPHGVLARLNLIHWVKNVTLFVT